MFQKTPALLLLLLFTGLCAYAQTAHVQGIVKDEKNNPLEVATVAVEGTIYGTTTNIRGEYTLDVPPGSHKMVFTLVGYVKQQTAITVANGDTKVVNAVLKKEATTL